MTEVKRMDPATVAAVRDYKDMKQAAQMFYEEACGDAVGKRDAAIKSAWDAYHVEVKTAVEEYNRVISEIKAYGRSVRDELTRPALTAGDSLHTNEVESV